MIGVIAKENEHSIVKEFFQLFKTPWEFYRKGESYDVVISTQNRTIEIDAKVLVIYGSELRQWDSDHELSLSSRFNNTFLNFNRIKVPIYGRISTFVGEIQPVLLEDRTSEVAGLKIETGQRKTFRLGYDLFDEVAFLLSSGQPSDKALVPTLEIHIAMLRSWIVSAGVPIIEIPPTPTGYDFMTCVTHDVDFVGIRYHKFDHTMWGFLYRSTMGSFFKLLRGKILWAHFLENWKAALSLPLVYLGLAQDFWLHFDTYLRIEKELSSTFFLIPFKDVRGERVDGRLSKRRATRYDITDILNWTKIILAQGNEIAVHGIDAWHSSEKGRQELRRISEISGGTKLGVRMHWLCFDRDSFQALERAGFSYDSTFGYNDAIGYRAGTMQVFRPIGAKELLELPLIIQDTAMFYRSQMGLSESRAWKLCRKLLKISNLNGGVLTILWHQRSLAPERLWGDFYVSLLHKLRGSRTWFGTARQVVNWFQKRRDITFKAAFFDESALRLELEYEGNEPISGLTLRVHLPQSRGDSTSREGPGYIDIPWNGQNELEISLN